jgi:predicted alpha/beta hydrolase
VETALHLVENLGAPAQLVEARRRVGHLPALVEQAQLRFPSSPRFVVGHSLGGQLSALYASAHAGAVHGLVLIAACNVHYHGWAIPERYRVLATALFFHLLGNLLGYVPAKKFGFGGNEARTVITDWSNNCFWGTYVVSGDDRDYEAALARLQIDVLGLSFAKDQLAPRDSVDRLLRKLAAASVTRRHFAADHPGLENA